MGKRLISKAELAKRAGVSRAAVTKVCKGKVNKAVVDGKIDLDHPAVVEYLKSRAAAKTKKTPKEANSKKASEPKTIKVKTPVTATVESDDKESITEKKHDPKEVALDKIMHLTLQELVELHGTDWQFENWVSAAKKIIEMRYKNVQLAELEGSLIPREMVLKVIFGAIENSNLRLLVDTPPTMVIRLFAMGKAGEALEDGEILVRELLSVQLKNIKTTAQRMLGDGTAKP